MARKITSAKIHSIALCKRGANRMPGIYKADDNDTVSVDLLLVKSSQQNIEEGILTAVVYAPNQRDSQNDSANEAVIKQMAHDFIRYGANLNINHDGVPLDKTQARVAETFIIQKNDPRFSDVTDAQGHRVDVTGAWGVLIKIDDPELRRKYSSGEWTGVSMEGVGTFEAEKSDIEKVADALASRFGLTKKQEIDMDAEALKKLLADNNAAIAKAVVDGLVAAAPAIAKSLTPEKTTTTEPTKPVAKTDEAPVFKGDYSDPAAVEKHAIALERFAIVQKHDVKTPEGARALAKELAEFDAEHAPKKTAKSEDKLSASDKAAGIEKSDSEEVKILKRKLFKAQGASKVAKAADASDADDDDADDDSVEPESPFTKSQTDGFALGSKMAKSINDRRAAEAARKSG